MVTTEIGKQSPLAGSDSEAKKQAGSSKRT
ncbi:hypothetical protein D918_06584 [Trichuris suis]|nr:hypothetical protein D918_06584 [Trichuris suis]